MLKTEIPRALEPQSLVDEFIDVLADEVMKGVVGSNSRPEKGNGMPESEFIAEMMEEIKKRHITRLVHFTRIESLAEIIRYREIASTRRLRDRYRMTVVNDRRRIDGHLDYVCCSIEYPNVYVLNRYREQNVKQDWVILFLTPILHMLPTTKFSPVNAATGGGIHVADGIEGFKSMFVECVPSRAPRRRHSHLPSCPTDIQAEVLVMDTVPIWAVCGVAVESDVVSARVAPVIKNWPLETPIPNWPIEKPTLTVEPLLFDKTELTQAIHGYRR